MKNNFLVQLLVSFIRLSTGLMAYWKSKINSEKSMHAMINLFCLTSGYSNEVLSFILSKLRPFARHKSADLWGTKVSSEEIDKIVEKLNIDGIVILDHKLPPQVIERFQKFALEQPASLRLSDYKIQKGMLEREFARIDFNNPQAVRYEFDCSLLAAQPFVQEILTQPFFREVSGVYLGTKPVLDIIQCWWHTSFGGVPDENAAQKYHFDMDRLKWLKVFIYLTDVEKGNGPHCFIKGSHRPGHIPWKLLKNGYRRLNDEDVLKYYNDQSILEILGKAGTIILEDTRGLHKGKHVEDKPRLMFELQYSNSFFGAPLPTQVKQALKTKSHFNPDELKTYEYFFEN